MRNKDKKYHYLYKTTNLINDKYYYGIHSTFDLEDGYLGSGTYLRRSILKYGKENFKREILEKFETREELIQAESDLITKYIVDEKLCMNLKTGGLGGSLGMVTIRNKNGLCFNVFLDDERYLSGELVSITKDRVAVKDENGKPYLVDINDERYLSGELIPITSGRVVVKDINGYTQQVGVNDERYLSGELIPINKGKINVKDRYGNISKVSINDEGYLSRELVGIWNGKTHSIDSRNKMSEKASLRNGDRNSSFGSCWITKNGINKKIKKDLLQLFINNGWVKGRVMK
jgi:hypothetical protein